MSLELLEKSLKASGRARFKAVGVKPLSALN